MSRKEFITDMVDIVDIKGDGKNPLVLILILVIIKAVFAVVEYNEIGEKFQKIVCHQNTGSRISED